MNKTGSLSWNSASLAKRQGGIVTTFTGVLILVLLTLMMFFAVRVGVFDQRNSSNDTRQKLAFHAAESGLQHAKEFFRANSTLAASPVIDIMANGTDGWLSTATGALRWWKCSDVTGIDLVNGHGSHPCFGEPNPDLRDDIYFYSTDGSGTPANVPINTGNLLPSGNEQVTVQALLCLLDIDYDSTTPVQGCSTNLTDDTAPAFVNGDHYMITLLARGRGDCVGNDCKSEALLREQVSNFGATSGGRPPSVPLTTVSSFPPSGTAEIVPNPNSGGVGVPVSVWLDANPSCNEDEAIIDPSSGAWATCEMQEWYGVDKLPEDYACPTANCSCSKDESISYTIGTDDILGIDLVADPNFPCDLFKFYFGVPKENYEVIKGLAKVLTNCSTLGPTSRGIYWISGSDCRIQSNTVVGGPKSPVLLISAAAVTELRGGVKIYGVLYISDAETTASNVQSNGTNMVFGQAIVDAAMGNYNGTFQVVYNENLIVRAASLGGLGNVIGGWSDFHPSWE